MERAEMREERRVAFAAVYDRGGHLFLTGRSPDAVLI